MSETSVFLKAIDVLNERGWGQGSYAIGDTGPVCLVGACAIAYGGISKFENSPHYRALSNITNRVFPHNWNDQDAKNKEEVIAILRKAHEYECELAKQIEHSSVQPA